MKIYELRRFQNRLRDHYFFSSETEAQKHFTRFTKLENTAWVELFRIELKTDLKKQDWLDLLNTDAPRIEVADELIEHYEETTINDLIVGRERIRIWHNDV